MAPVILLKTRKDNDNEDMFKTSGLETKTQKSQNSTISHVITPSSKVFNDYNWDVIDEYDPLWPNEYDKLKEKREKLEKERDYSREDRKRRSGKYDDTSPPPAKLSSGFGGRPDEDEYLKSPTMMLNRTGGAKIAPPASLQENSTTTPFSSDSKGMNLSGPYGSGSVAAKIMAKYGFKVCKIVFSMKNI